jgi:hypothetical protein
MDGVLEQRFEAVDSCVDYQSYVYAIDPNLSREQYAVSCRSLLTIGRADEERMGVVYVRGPWGFFVIPHYGYPTLRISFFHDTPAIDSDEVLGAICAAFETNDAILDQGDLSE